MTKRRRAQIGRMCVNNPASPIGKPIGRERALELRALRKTHGKSTGRRRSKDRCPCGVMTRQRAEKRRHKCVALEVAK